MRQFLLVAMETCEKQCLLVAIATYEKQVKLTDANIASINARIFQTKLPSRKSCVVGVRVCEVGGRGGQKKTKEKGDTSLVEKRCPNRYTHLLKSIKKQAKN